MEKRFLLDLLRKKVIITTFDAESDPKADLKIVDRTPGNEVAFNFIFSKELSTLLKANQKTNFSVGAEVQVNYVNSQKRRFAEEILAGEVETDTYSTSSEVEDPTLTVTASGTGATGTTGSATGTTGSGTGTTGSASGTGTGTGTGSGSGTTGSGTKTTTSSAFAICASFILMIVALF